MNINRLILIIATALTLSVSVPRVLFLLSDKDDQVISSVIQVSVEDTLFRMFLLFSFSYVVLRFNLIWINLFNDRYRLLALTAVNATILMAWQLIFYLVNTFIYNIHASVISPGINAMTYFFFLVILVLISTAIRLINKSRLDTIEKEVLKQKSLESELEALKNQINPHFLFNSLSTLSHLVREDQKAAGKFINKLSFLYRYILLSQGKELVSIKEELKVLGSYVHLIQQRYQENFHVKINISDHVLEKRIPILSLQLLMENAIKHNEISTNKPLYIALYDENNWIVMENVLQKRTGHTDSTNVGLKNLNARTKLHMRKEIIIQIKDTHFTVKIPTL